ncbi:GNAT family N-acetyltransferase [Tsukamurella sp. 1534]|uniref:GNAT family N-acetyltransferase n=1 Tax=Tsukamurella sp. 1534 TaxID=1151061 RepID=UPI00059444FE|nr:N-acetyltransferase [Tsukamurella sp. 1534]
MLIRKEAPQDAAAVEDVHRSAFAPMTPPGRTDPVEVELVQALRDSGAWIEDLSFVAERDDEVVGHVCLTRGTVGNLPALALGPLGVRADAQGLRIGSALMHAAIGAAEARREGVVVLLGHVGYYPHFGFVPAASLGITPDVAEWAGPSFMARPLDAYTPELRGEFRYPAPFYEL